MMYILTQEEFDALQEKNRKIAEDARNVIQDLCTRVANSEPVKEGWYAGKPWVVSSQKKVSGIVMIALSKMYVQKTLKNGVNDARRSQ